MVVYLRGKLEVFSVILLSFRQGGNFTTSPLPTLKRTPKKPTQIRVKLWNLYLIAGFDLESLFWVLVCYSFPPSRYSYSSFPLP